VREQVTTAFDEGSQTKLRRLDLALAFLVAEVDVAEAAASIHAPGYDPQIRGPLLLALLGCIVVATGAALTVRMGPPAMKVYGSLAGSGAS
jgi:hypothetical protein